MFLPEGPNQTAPPSGVADITPADPETTQADIALMQRVLSAASRNPNLIPADFMSYIVDFIQISRLQIPIGQVPGYSRQVASSASYYAGASTLASTGSNVLMPLNTQVFGSTGFSLSGNRIVLPKAGYWLCVGRVTFPASNTTGVRECDIGHYATNGGFSHYFATDDTPGEALIAQQVLAVGVDQFQTNEQVSLAAFQDSGGSLTLPGGNAYVSQALTVVFLGS